MACAMPVRTVNVTSIEARRFSGAEESNPDQVRIDHNSTVTMVEQVGDDTAEVDFRYTASYGGLGVIKLEGKAHFQGDAEELASTWRASSEMPENVASEIHTAVMRLCVPEAVQLAQDLQLPPPIPLPEIRFEEGQGEAAIEGEGREVH